MQFYRKAGSVLRIPLEKIRPNPAQPRRHFEERALSELSESIRRYGVLQPLTVRRKGDEFELVAGERRLRASALAGLREVPCIVAAMGDEDSAALALVENLQRQDLHYFEEAEAMAKLIGDYGLSQEEVGRRLGKSQSAVANKLRLLRLSEADRALLRQANLSERHARALLRLEEEGERTTALRYIIDHGLNVAQSETYIDQRLAHLQTAPPQRRATFILKDVRLFLNSVERGLGVMRRAGVDAGWDRRDTDSEILLTIRIPKQSGR